MLEALLRALPYSWAEQEQSIECPMPWTRAGVRLVSGYGKPKSDRAGKRSSTPDNLWKKRTK
jgi:hypothetical protein